MKRLGVALLLGVLLVGLFVQPTEANQDQHERHALRLESVEDVIRFHASSRGVDGERLVRLAVCESSLRPDAVGDHGTSLGLFQLSTLPTGLLHHFLYVGFDSPWDTEQVTRYVVAVAAGDYLPDGPEPAPLHPFGRVTLARWSCSR